MKKLMMVLATAFAAAMPIMAATETVGGYTWTYEINGGKAVIDNYYSTAIAPAPTGTLTIPSKLGGKPVTGIGGYALKWCSDMTGVTIPDSVTSIEERAFWYCSGLTDVTIPGRVTSIGESAFLNCVGLKSVTIPKSVTSIGLYAFYQCNRLTTVHVVKGDTGRVKGLLSGSGHDVSGLTFVEDVASGGSSASDPASDPVLSCYDVLKAADIREAFVAPKAVTLQGAVYDGCAVVGIVELKLGKVSKGKSKVSGSFTGLDGKKITLKAVPVTGIDGNSPAAVSLDVKGYGKMNLTIGGSRFAGSLSSYHVQSATVGGNWTGRGATVTVEANDLSMFAGRVLADFLPNDEQATVNNGKWTFNKAASVKWAKPKKDAVRPDIYDEDSQKGLIVDTSKGKTNLSGLKLTYTPKKGTYKGKFTLYALEGSGKATKLKKYTFNVTGVVVDGVGYGVATSKKPTASWAVTVR